MPTGKPLVLLVHGGFWRPAYDRRHTRAMAAALRDAGWPVASLEYRRVPGHPELTTGDVRCAIAELPKLLAHHNARETVMAGHSAGGHLALWAAATCPPEGLAGTLALAPVADLVLADQTGLGDGAVTAFLGTAAVDRRDLDPVRGTSPTAPVILLHGTDDVSVPVEVGESYLRAHPATNFDALPGTGHFELIDPRAPVFPRVVRAIHTLGQKPPRTPSSAEARG